MVEAINFNVNYEMLGEMIPVSSVICQNTPEGNILYINKMALNKFRLKNTDEFLKLFGKSLRDFTLGSSLNEGIYYILQEKKQFSFDSIYHTDEGEDISVRFITKLNKVEDVSFITVSLFNTNCLSDNLSPSSIDIITSLTKYYNTMYEVYLDEDRCIAYQCAKRNDKFCFKCLNVDSYSELMKACIDNIVIEGKDELGELLDIDGLIDKMNNNDMITYSYKAYISGDLRYHDIDVVKTPDFENNHRVFMGLSDVHEKKLSNDQMVYNKTLSMLSSIAFDYITLIDINLNTQKERVFFIDDNNKFNLQKWSENDDFRHSIVEYGNNIVCENDRERFLLETKPDHLLKHLKEDGEYVIEYQANVNDTIRFFQGRFILENISDNESHIMVGIRDITDAEFLRFKQENDLKAAVEAEKIANQAKSTFLFNMSHDIRTPMNAIMGYAELLGHTMDQPDKQKAYVENIQKSGKYLLDLINNVLEMARIESGKIILDEEPCDLVSLVDEVASVFENSYIENELTVHRDFEISYPNVFCDLTKCKQIVLNIISNSIKYTPAGGDICISVRNERIENNKVLYTVVFEDSGIGMSKEFLPHIFDSFSREKTVTENKIIGTGLGMGIVKRLVDLMDGTIEVESELGVGTKITLKIPFRIAKTIISDDSKVEFDFNLVKGKRVLLAEDNDLNAEICQEVLTNSGLYVERAEDGIVAIDMLLKVPATYYDLILMDIQMPNMDGLKATTLIRNLSDKKKASIPIIAMTANVFEEDRRKAKEAGMDGFVGKPFDINSLFIEIIKCTN